MSKLGNILGKGFKVASHVAVGSLAYGLGTAAMNFHPEGVVGVLWNVLGVSLTSGAVAAMVRWSGFDPSKLGK